MLDDISCLFNIRQKINLAFLLPLIFSIVSDTFFSQGLLCIPRDNQKKKPVKSKSNWPSWKYGQRFDYLVFKTSPWNDAINALRLSLPLSLTLHASSPFFLFLFDYRQKIRTKEEKKTKSIGFTSMRMFIWGCEAIHSIHIRIKWPCSNEQDFELTCGIIIKLLYTVKRLYHKHYQNLGNCSDCRRDHFQGGYCKKNSLGSIKHHQLSISPQKILVWFNLSAFKVVFFLFLLS